MLHKFCTIVLVTALAMPFVPGHATSPMLEDDLPLPTATDAKPAPAPTPAAAQPAMAAVLADVKWAHRLAILCAATGMMAGLVQLGYIRKYWCEQDQGSDQPRWYCQDAKDNPEDPKVEFSSENMAVFLNQYPILGNPNSDNLKFVHNLLPRIYYEKTPKILECIKKADKPFQDQGSKATTDLLSCYLYDHIFVYNSSKGTSLAYDHNTTTILNISYGKIYPVNLDYIKLWGMIFGVTSTFFTIATARFYRNPPVLAPEGASIVKRRLLAPLCYSLLSAAWLCISGLILMDRPSIKESCVSVVEGLPRGALVQWLSLGGLVLCKTYASLRVSFLKNKPASAPPAFKA